MRVFLGFVLGLFCLAGPVAGQVLPAQRSFGAAWRHAGSGDLVLPDTTVNVRDFGAAGNGLVNDRPAVAAAIAALGGAPGVVYFPPGTYLIQSAVSVPSGVVLYGHGPDDTAMIFDFCAQAIRVYGQETGVWVAVTQAAVCHQSLLTVSNGAAFSGGDYALVRQENDPAWNITDTWAYYSAGQIVRITDVTGNTLALETPLRHDYPLSRNPEIRRIIPNRNSGVANIRLERLPAGDPASRNNIHTIHFSYAAGGWVRGVHSRKGFGSHVGIDNSTGVSVTGCYFDEAYEYDDGGSGYGVKVEARSGQCLIEDNVFRSLRHAMLLQSGANGNVFGYNYSREARSDSHPTWAGDVALHGNYPYANLFEGNIVEHLWIDDSHNGLNGPYNTFFRNRAEKCGFNMTQAADRQNVFGNELFKGDWLAQIAVGNGYRFQGTDHFTYGNNTKAAGLQPPGTGDLSDYSYYLNDNPLESPLQPDWWTIPYAFPIIGPPRAMDTAKDNPARARYLAGSSSALILPAPAPYRRPGDINGDRAINVSDAVFCLRMAVHLAVNLDHRLYIFPYPGLAIPADINADGVIDIRDLALCLYMSIQPD